MKNQRQCKPPLARTELETIAERAAQFEPNVATDADGLFGGSKELWWFPFDVRDWCSNSQLAMMRDYHVGWFIACLVECWKGAGYLVYDLEHLAAIVHARNTKRFKREFPAMIQRFGFEPVPGSVPPKLVHIKMLQQFEKKVALVRSKRRGGLTSAARRQQPEVPNAA